VQLNTETIKFLRYYLNYCYDFNWLNNSLNQHYKEHFEEHQSKLKVKFKEWMYELVNKTSELKTNADRFANQLNGIIDQSAEGWRETLLKRVKDAQGYFVPILKNASNSIFAHLENLKEEKKVKQYTTELMKLEVLFFEQIKKVEKAVGLCEAILKGEEYTKSQYRELIHDSSREVKIAESETIKKRTKKEKAPPKEKVDTKQLTFDLYKEGKTIEQIAELRNFAITTIEGHLAYYVATGELNASDFISPAKIDAIAKVAQELKTASLKLIKAEMDDSYSYADIKFAMAALEQQGV
jgi:uncharacterized protein YpbB